MVACEAFGPLAPVLEVEDLDDAIALANGTPYGLSAGVVTRNLDLAIKAIKGLRAGTVNINEGYISAWGSVDAPMGGMKDSGLGRRHGAGGLLKYTESQTISVQRLMPLAARTRSRWRVLSARGGRRPTRRDECGLSGAPSRR